MTNYIDFYDNLKKTITDLESPHKNILNYCPEFYLLLCNILIDKKTDWNTKILINSAISYFVLKDDIIPDDDIDGMGYIDDLFITSFVLMEIKDNRDESLLIEHWHTEGNILKIVDDVFIKSKILVGDKYIEILQLVGLKKYISLDLGEFGDSSKRISRLVKEKNELLGILAFITQKVYSVGRFKDLEGIKRVLRDVEDYGEIERIIFIAQNRKMDSKEFKTSIDLNHTDILEELKKKRLERILNGLDNDV